MGEQLGLPVCVLPGCRTLVAEAGDVCDGCRTACGNMLRHNPGGERMTPDAIAERDHAVWARYAAARRMGYR